MENVFILNYQMSDMKFQNIKYIIGVIAFLLVVQSFSWERLIKNRRRVLLFVQTLLLLHVISHIFVIDLMEMMVQQETVLAFYVIVANSIDIILLSLLLGVILVFVNLGIGLYYTLNDVEFIGKKN